MRDILFRGKSVDNGEWVEGDLIQFHSGVCKIAITIPNIPKDYKGASKNIEKVSPETVGQYTGLCDKNGNKIFEGDIVETRFGTSLINFDECRGFGGYSNRRRKEGSLIHLAGIDLTYGIIIGNIHDNPKLLEEK